MESVNKNGFSADHPTLLNLQLSNSELVQNLLRLNQELAQQNEEKEKRAAELILINQELAFQMAENEKRALDLEAAVKELEFFSYSVSHDLRTPLRAINGFTQVLAEDYTNLFDADGKEALNEIISNSSRMGQLIDNLLEFFRVGKHQVVWGQVNIKALVKGVITELRQLSPLYKVQIELKDLPDAMGDRAMLKQVFQNLISNAIKYTGKTENATIEIGCKPEQEEFIYYVRDNGAGFDMRYYDKLFCVFQRLHSSHEFEGNGVGLAIVQKIIMKHGGKTWAEGKVKNGACFYFSLPKQV